MDERIIDHAFNTSIVRASLTGFELTIGSGDIFLQCGTNIELVANDTDGEIMYKITKPNCFCNQYAIELTCIACSKQIRACVSCHINQGWMVCNQSMCARCAQAAFVKMDKRKGHQRYLVVSIAFNKIDDHGFNASITVYHYRDKRQKAVMSGCAVIIPITSDPFEINVLQEFNAVMNGND